MANTQSRSTRARKRESGSKPREISIDDVVQQLLELFDRLGLDASRLATRLTNRRVPRRAPAARYPHASLIGELLRAWHQDVGYLDKSANPISLKMNVGRKSFRRLANKTIPNMDPKRLLIELQRIGAVSVDTKGNIRALVRSLPVYEDKNLAARHTLAALDSFVRTLVHNLKSDAFNSEQFFHRVAWNGEFDGAEIPALKIRIKREGQNFLESCDNWMSRRSTRTRRNQAGAQVSVGVYMSIS